MSGVRVFVPFPLEAVQLVKEIGIINVEFVGIDSDDGSCFEGIRISVAILHLYPDDPPYFWCNFLIFQRYS